MLFNVIYYFSCKFNGDETPSFIVENRDDFSFSKLSKQWLIVITFIPILLSLFLKKLTLLAKFAELGVYAIFSYVIFIFYCFFSNFHNMGKGLSSAGLFTFEVGELSGTAALAFTIHSTVGPIMKCNKI